MIITVNRKVSDKTQKHLWFETKTRAKLPVFKLWIEGNFLTLIKDNYSKLKANIILIKVKSKAMIFNVNSIVNIIPEILTNTGLEKAEVQ